MRNAATRVVEELIKYDHNVLALSADSRNESYQRILDKYPEQYIEYGIAEENMVASAAGLASCGKIPFLLTFSNFMVTHAYEFLRNDVCIENNNVKFLGRSVGLVSSNMGPTHQGTEELGLLRPLPNLCVITPSTPIMARESTKFAYNYRGPVYIRLEGFNEPEYYPDDFAFEYGKGYIIREGDDIAIISMGSIVSEALQVAEQLQAELSVAVIDMPVAKPVDRDLIKRYSNKCKMIISLEEHSINCGLGSSIAEVIAEEDLHVMFKRFGLNSCVDISADRKTLRSRYGIDAKSIAGFIRHSFSV